jgi:hypothetical protein
VNARHSLCSCAAAIGTAASCSSPSATVTAMDDLDHAQMSAALLAGDRF